MDCVEVYPAYCFHTDENRLVVHLDECIDCGVREPECPAEAIVPGGDGRAGAWLKRNTLSAKQWPNITGKGEPPADAAEWKDKPCEEALFSPERGNKRGKP